MNTLKTKILTVGMAGALIGIASNLPGQDVPGRWYLGLDTGLALQQDITVKDTGGGKLSFDPGVRLDVSGGMHLSECWKAELELGFMYNSLRAADGGDQGYFQMPLMANGIYTLPLRGPVNIYVGAGAGGVYGVLWQGIFSEDSFTFGYQGIVGVKCALNEQLDFGLAYKLLGTLDHDLGGAQVEGSLSHSILAAFTFKF